jgi:hypothetical protein
VQFKKGCQPKNRWESFLKNGKFILCTRIQRPCNALLSSVFLQKLQISFCDHFVPFCDHFVPFCDHFVPDRAIFYNNIIGYPLCITVVFLSFLFALISDILRYLFHFVINECNFTLFWCNLLLGSLVFSMFLYHNETQYRAKNDCTNSL